MGVGALGRPTGRMGKPIRMNHLFLTVSIVFSISLIIWNLLSYWFASLLWTIIICSLGSDYPISCIYPFCFSVAHVCLGLIIFTVSSSLIHFVHTEVLVSWVVDLFLWSHYYGMILFVSSKNLWVLQVGTKYSSYFSYWDFHTQRIWPSYPWVTQLWCSAFLPGVPFHPYSTCMTNFLIALWGWQAELVE